MKYFNHLITGVMTGFFVADKLGINPLIALPICAAGTIVSDLDYNNSFINKILFPVSEKVRPLYYNSKHIFVEYIIMSVYVVLLLPSFIC